MREILNSPLEPGSTKLLDIQRYFIEHSLNLASIQEAVIGIASVIGGLLLLMLFLHFRPRKPYIPQDWILDKAQIADILDQALIQRAKFDLQFPTEGDMQHPTLRCTILSVVRKSIIIETSGPATLSNRWIGKNVDCFFFIQRREGPVFFAFSTIISAIEPSDTRCTIRLSMPERLEKRQKRFYLRIVPPEEFMLGAALWLAKAMPDNASMDDLALWSKPTRIFLPGTRNDFSIRDVSSGGLRIHLPSHIFAEETDHLHVGAQFITMLDLWDPDASKRVRYWLLCSVQNLILDFATKGMNIGVQFLSWAKPADDGGSSLLWLKLASPGEVEPLGTWVIRRNLEYLRATEQDS